jgi:hypothetical protein
MILLPGTTEISHFTVTEVFTASIFRIEAACCPQTLIVGDGNLSIEYFEFWNMNIGYLMPEFRITSQYFTHVNITGSVLYSSECEGTTHCCVLLLLCSVHCATSVFSFCAFNVTPAIGRLLPASISLKN